MVLLPEQLVDLVVEVSDFIVGQVACSVGAGQGIV